MKRVKLLLLISLATSKVTNISAEMNSTGNANCDQSLTLPYELGVIVGLFFFSLMMLVIGILIGIASHSYWVIKHPPSNSSKESSYLPMENMVGGPGPWDSEHKAAACIHDTPDTVTHLGDDKLEETQQLELVENCSEMVDNSSINEAETFYQNVSTVKSQENVDVDVSMQLAHNFEECENHDDTKESLSKSEETPNSPRIRNKICSNKHRKLYHNVSMIETHPIADVKLHARPYTLSTDNLYENTTTAVKMVASKSLDLLLFHEAEAEEQLYEDVDKCIGTGVTPYLEDKGFKYDYISYTDAVAWVKPGKPRLRSGSDGTDREHSNRVVKDMTKSSTTGRVRKHFKSGIEQEDNEEYVVSDLNSKGSEEVTKKKPVPLPYGYRKVDEEPLQV